LRIRAAVHGLASPGLTHALKLVSTFGGPGVLGPLAVLLVVVFGWRRWWRGTVLLLTAMAGALVHDLFLKQPFHR
jgi:hypothetical protein